MEEFEIDCVTKQKSTGDLPPHFDNPNDINEHFLNIPGKERVTISQLTYFQHHRQGKATFSLQPVSEDAVLKIINGLKSNARGSDEVSLDMLRLTLPQSLGAITAIINQSILDGVFPNSWKTAIIRPLPKVGVPSTMSDLRPISLLPILSKVLERVVCEQLTRYLEEHNILPQRQSGFRRGSVLQLLWQTSLITFSLLRTVDVSAYCCSSTFPARSTR